MKPLHRRLLYFEVVLLFLSGAAWTYWNYFVASRGEFEMAARAWAMKIHGGAAMAILVLIGMLLTGHVRIAGSESLRAWASWIHLGLGLALPLLLIFHVWLGKRTRVAVLPQKRMCSIAKIDAM